MAAPGHGRAPRSIAGRPLRLGLVNYDDDPGAAERYGIQGLPTVLVVKGGEARVRRVGLMGRAELRRMLDDCR